jgi:signal transduction histidine kinase
LALFLANQQLAPATLLLAATVPATWVVWRLRRRLPLATITTLAAAALLGSWWISYTSGTAAAEPLEQARRVLALGGTGLLFIDRALETWRLRPSKPMTMGRAAVNIVAILAVGAVFSVVYVAAFPTPVLAVVLVLVLLAAAPARTYVGSRLESALMADLRTQVEADVAEEERARLARELHDVPLQELSGVIRRLELDPAAKDATRSLRAIADELRAVAVDLRPPMLDDLGLGAALDFLAEQTTGEAARVDVRIDDSTGPEPDRRPPPAVELAVYRIANEAVSNAMSHARASAVSITAAVSRNSISLEIADDGVGLRDLEARRASSRGHLGLTSMRRRAQAIGAELSILGSATGTRVVLTWQG